MKSYNDGVSVTSVFNANEEEGFGKLRWFFSSGITYSCSLWNGLFYQKITAFISFIRYTAN